MASDLSYAVPAESGSMVCKALPDAPQHSIVAIAHSQPDDAVDSADFDLDVAIVDSATRHVIARALQKDAFASNAREFDGIEIDTGRYRLAKGVRAFGVRASSGGSSRYSPDADTTLDLFVRDGAHLRKIVDGLPIQSTRGENSDGCTGNSTDLQRTIAIAPTSTHGFADLVVTSSVTQSRDTNSGDHCKRVNEKPEITQTTLHYDGAKYAMPAQSNDF